MYIHREEVLVGAVVDCCVVGCGVVDCGVVGCVSVPLVAERQMENSFCR